MLIEISLGSRLKSMVSILAKVVDWLGFSLLGMLAIVSITESWDAYASNKTGWSVEHQPIPDHPTFILRFGLSRTSRPFDVGLILGLDFNISLISNGIR